MKWIDLIDTLIQSVPCLAATDTKKKKIVRKEKKKIFTDMTETGVDAFFFFQKRGTTSVPE